MRLLQIAATAAAMVAVSTVSVADAAVNIIRVAQDAQEESSVSLSPCSVCPNTGTQLKTNQIPLPWTASMNRRAPEMFVDHSFLVHGKEFSATNSNNLTCQEWNDFATTQLNNDTASCLDLRDYLNGPCCDDPNKVLPPLYQCQSAAENATIWNNNSSAYNKNKSPALVDAPSALQIEVQMDVFNAEVGGITVI